MKKHEPNYIAYFDGATEPVNPGGACGIGSLILDSLKNRLLEYSHFIPMNKSNSNNVAEYLAFIKILEWFEENEITNKTILIYGDSMLVVKQMNNQWRIKKGLYKKYALKAKNILSSLKSKNNIIIKWISRDYNYLADELSKHELINHKIEFRLQPI